MIEPLVDDLSYEVRGEPSCGTVLVLGCDGSYPGPGGACSGYLVRTGGTTVWLDAGPGTFANLQRLADPADVDAVVLTHEHPDHWTDFESYVVWARLTDHPRPAPVFAPPGLRRRSYFADDPAVDWRLTVPDQEVEIGDLSLRFAATDHGPPTLAVRFDSRLASSERPADQALAYSADTGPEWSVESLGWGIGTFVCEASFDRSHEGREGHLSGHQAGSMAADADVVRLVLTHRWPTVDAGTVADEAASRFGSPVATAEVGKVILW